MDEGFDAILMACRQVSEADAEAAKKAEVRAQVCRTHTDSSSSKSTPNSSAEISSKPARAASADQPPESAPQQAPDSTAGERVAIFLPGLVFQVWVGSAARPVCRALDWLTMLWGLVDHALVLGDHA